MGEQTTKNGPESLKKFYFYFFVKAIRVHWKKFNNKNRLECAFLSIIYGSANI